MDWQGSCQLDQEGCLSLDQILHSFSAPISEEHAWAIIHQSLQCLSKLLDSLAKPDLGLLACVVTRPSQILISSEGSMHTNSFLKTRQRETRQRLVSENKTVAELGVVIFNALDFGLKDEEERQLSPALENMIDLITSADEDEDLTEGGDTDDEGIEKDHDYDEKETGDSMESQDRMLGNKMERSGMCDSLIELCRHHLALPSEADLHFRAVCRALVSEALEISSFMEKVSENRQEQDSELNELGLNDWARLWVQVIHELRSGLKLKKTDYSKTPVEFELTPYEILMDDIRSRRYKLNKVMVEGRLPHRVKRDAHDVILDFIRSRPPLKPAGDRKLTAIRKQSTPVELLMESIRSQSTRHSLRKTSGPPTRLIGLTGLETSRCKMELDWEESPMSNKRVIQPDPDLVSSLLNFSTDEEDEESSAEEEEEEKEIVKSVEKKQQLCNNWHKHLALDQLLHSPRPPMSRRHSVSVCQTPSQHSRTRSSKQKISVELDQEDSEESELSQMSSFDSPLNSIPGSPYRLDTPAMHATLHSEFIHSDQWVAALQTLELTFEEVVHIRSVLARAELEALPLDNNLKDDVEKGKICFLCMKTRFSLFQWGSRCQMCSQQVCGKCSAKMRIPLEHFSAVPVFVLSPQTPSTPATPIEEEQGLASRLCSSLAPSISMFSSAGSAPSSPINRRKMGHQNNTKFALSRPASAGPTSLPVLSNQQSSSLATSLLGDVRRVLSREDRRSSLLGTLLTVCHDCKEMVLQVIRVKKTARRLQMTQSLFLNLSPVYPKEEVH